MAGTILALANQKGGVGKTTTALNLAACLAEAGERTLVIDLDPQANATSGLGERANGSSSLDLLDGVELSQLVRPTRFPRLELVPSRRELAGAAVELSRRADGERYLADALAGAGEAYSFVFVDCPPSLGPLTVNALAAADRVLVPVQAEYYALEGLAQLVSSVELVRLPVETIHPNPRQPRRRFDHESTSALADSIRAQGLVQPVVVRPRAEGGFELIAGERRWRAALEARIPTVPAMVRAADDRDTLLLGLVENVAREELTAVEEARAYAMLLDEFDLSLGDLAERVGKAKPTVSNRLRLLELPDDVLGLVERGDLTEGHARAVLAVPDHDGRRRLARQIVRRGMSVRAAERAARWAGARTKPRRVTRIDPALADRARKAAERATGFPVRLTSSKLEIGFGDEIELAELVEALERLTA